MAETIMDVESSGDIEGQARYAVKDGTVPLFGRAPADDRSVIFQDMRAVADPPQLLREGFELVRHESAVQNFEDADAVANVYLDEIKALIGQGLGADHVFMQQNWVLRGEARDYTARDLPGGKNQMTMKTGGFVHIDYDEAAAEAWARYTFEKAGIAERPAGRLLVITAWRTISPPPQDLPLALIDRRTVDTASYIEERIESPLLNWTGFQIAYDPAHRFCWWSNQQRDELILFLQHEEGYGPGAAAPHTAFVHALDDRAIPRQSIEVRAYAFVND